MVNNNKAFRLLEVAEKHVQSKDSDGNGVVTMEVGEGTEAVDVSFVALYQASLNRFMAIVPSDKVVDFIEVFGFED